MSALESVSVPRKIWTRNEVKCLSSASDLPSSLELVCGELIDKRLGKNRPHIYWKNRLLIWLGTQFGFDYVRPEDPIDVAPEDNPTSEPEPDLAVTLRSTEELRYEKVNPKDLLLVVEVADSTFDYDCTVKAALYARAGIEEYWVVDIRDANAPRLLRHLKPFEGSYQILTTCGYEGTLVFKGHNLRLKDLG